MVSGEFLPLEEFRGKTVVLTFWATWCSHSSQLLSDLGAAAAKFQNRPDIMFLNVSVDKADDLEKVKTRLRDAALTSTKNAFSGNAEYDEAFISFRCTDLPQVYILDPAGVVLAAGDSISVVEEHVK
jgi:thiol-disulfide isomerase/thioredoxin